MASQSSSFSAFTQKTIFQHKPFRTIWLAQFVSIFGDFLALFGVISLITFKLHGTAVQVTAVTIAYVLPLAVISPVAGVFVDHWNVKRVMIASDLMRALLITVLVFVTDIGQICAIFALLKHCFQLLRSGAVSHSAYCGPYAGTACGQRHDHASVLYRAAVFAICRGSADRGHG